MSETAIEVYLEVGKQRTFASAVEWPGWSRGGRDSSSALRALAEYGPRYGRAIGEARLGFRPPSDPTGFEIVEQLVGSSSTDFGVPALPASADGRGMDAAEVARSEKILEACWKTFDHAVAEVRGELRKGPRGGGRELEAIVKHVFGADGAYLGGLGWAFKLIESSDLQAELDRTRREILLGLEAGARGEIEPRGPRGGQRWKPRYFVRRVAWHVLDHAWEIEDRSE